MCENVSAILFVTILDKELIDKGLADKRSVKLSTRNDEDALSQWVTHIQVELTKEGKLTLDNCQKHGDYLIDMPVANATLALKIARLIRSTFQLSLIPKNNRILSIGVILYDPRQSVVADMADKAKALACDNHDLTGNKILLEDWTKESRP